MMEPSNPPKPAAEQTKQQKMEKFGTWYQEKGQKLAGHAYTLVLANKVSFQISGDTASKLFSRIMTLLPSFLAYIEENEEFKAQSNDLRTTIANWRENFLTDTAYLQNEKAVTIDQATRGASSLDEFLSNAKELEETAARVSHITGSKMSV